MTRWQWRADDRRRDQEHGPAHQILEEGYLDRASMLRLAAHDDDVERVDQGRHQYCDAAEQRGGSEVGLRLPDEDHYDTGEGGDRPASRALADRLLEDERG